MHQIEFVCPLGGSSSALERSPLGGVLAFLHGRIPRLDHDAAPGHDETPIGCGCVQLRGVGTTDGVYAQSWIDDLRVIEGTERSPSG